MQSISNKYNKKFIYLIIFYFLFLISKASGDIYSEIEVSGNERISVETIVMFSGVSI